MTGANTLERDTLFKLLESLSKKAARLEAILNGQPITTVRIANATITNAKIVTVSADKITTGQLSVGTIIDIGDSAGGDYIRVDGGNVRILMYVSGVPQFLIGEE